MIRRFKHRGLERYFLRGTRSGIPTQFASKIRLILGRLNASVRPQDMSLPELHLHELSGKRRGMWSVRVSGNWRITFKYDGEDAIDVNLEDYH